MHRELGQPGWEVLHVRRVVIENGEKRIAMVLVCIVYGWQELQRPDRLANIRRNSLDPLHRHDPQNLGALVIYCINTAISIHNYCSTEFQLWTVVQIDADFNRHIGTGSGAVLFSPPLRRENPQRFVWNAKYFIRRLAGTATRNTGLEFPYLGRPGRC